MVSKVDLFLSDYHTHNSWCNHARGNVEDYIKAAIAKGLNEIGLAGHFPMNLMPHASQVDQWAMNPDQFPEYLTLCHGLREKYKDQIEVAIRSEILDKNTCKNCLAIDGNEYDIDSPEFQDMAAGPYAHCEGQGQCRGINVFLIKQQ